MAALWVAGGTISVQEPGPTQGRAAQESAARKAPTVRGEVPRRQRQLDDRAPLPGKARCSHREADKAAVPGRDRASQRLVHQLAMKSSGQVVTELPVTTRATGAASRLAGLL